jgi:hypothetical protein
MDALLAIFAPGKIQGKNQGGIPPLGTNILFATRPVW